MAALVICTKREITCNIMAALVICTKREITCTIQKWKTKKATPYNIDSDVQFISYLCALGLLYVKGGQIHMWLVTRDYK
jgi:5-enolpyruvylshikimate-3-phosphate synthase